MAERRMRNAGRGDQTDTMPMNEADAPKLKLGVAVPTCTEGLMYPAPFASVSEAVEVATTAEELGFDSVWANDHLNTQRYVREQYSAAPSFLDPWSYLAHLSGCTSRIGLATGITVLPFRHPVVLAKQAATLDQLSQGRLILGVGIGAYREEFEAIWPGRPLRRGQFAGEAMESLQLLFTQRCASYQGEWITFHDVESHPKPFQHPLPMLSGGNSPGSRRRAAQLASGWMPGCLLPAEIKGGLVDIHTQAAEAGRKLDGFDVGLQLGVTVRRTKEEAVQAFLASQFAEHFRSLAGSTLAHQQDDLVARNLVGTPEGVAEQISHYRAAGVTTLAGMIFTASSVAEMTDAMSEFMAEVAPILEH
jgi:probable F420-dependent oxidoreductase